MTSPDDIRKRWLAQMLATEPASRSRADACWANALLTAPHSITWANMVKGLDLFVF
jgi:hypothetical protein